MKGAGAFETLFFESVFFPRATRFIAGRKLRPLPTYPLSSSLESVERRDEIGQQYAFQQLSRNDLLHLRSSYNPSDCQLVESRERFPGREEIRAERWKISIASTNSRKRACPRVLNPSFSRCFNYFSRTTNRSKRTCTMSLSSLTSLVDRCHDYLANEGSRG